MSREILFKGKSTATGEWTEGGYFEAPHGCFISETVWENEKKWSQWARTVDPSTVCQYTGLTDRNGVKIFEGDIVKIFDYPDCYGCVRFGSYADVRGTVDACYGWYIEFLPNNDYYRQDFGNWANKIVVVGNCFNNPELLQVAAQHADQDVLALAT